MAENFDNFKILIIGINDTDSQLTVVERLLANSLTNCTFISDIESAYKELTATTFQIIIIDVDNVIDYSAFLSILNSKTKKTFVLLISTAPNRGLIDCLFKHPAYRLRKPIDDKEFDEVICFIKQKPLISENIKGSIRKASLEFSIESNSRALDHAYRLLTAFFVYTIHKNEFNYLRLGLQEILRNALEHGALDISSEEKIALCEAGKLEETIEKRSKERNNLVINLRLELGEDEIKITTIDPGEGFNWKNKLNKLENNSYDILGVSNRGLFIIKQIFDTVVFNEKGNEITVVKRLSKCE